MLFARGTLGDGMGGGALGEGVGVVVGGGPGGAGGALGRPGPRGPRGEIASPNVETFSRLSKPGDRLCHPLPRPSFFFLSMLLLNRHFEWSVPAAQAVAAITTAAAMAAAARPTVVAAAPEDAETDA